MSDKDTGNLPVVVTKAYDVLLRLMVRQAYHDGFDACLRAGRLISCTGKFPRSHRFAGGLFHPFALSSSASLF